jgi:hypothetical protein
MQAAISNLLISLVKSQFAIHASHIAQGLVENHPHRATMNHRHYSSHPPAPPSHTQFQIQLIQIPDSLTSCIQLIPSISNQHSHPDKRNRFCRDCSDALGEFLTLPQKAAYTVSISGFGFSHKTGKIPLRNGVVRGLKRPTHDLAHQAVQFRPS